MEISVNGTIIFYFCKPRLDAACISNHGTLFGFSWGWEYWRQAAPVAFSKTVEEYDHHNRAVMIKFGRHQAYLHSEWGNSCG